MFLYRPGRYEIHRSLLYLAQALLPSDVLPRTSTFLDMSLTPSLLERKLRRDDCRSITYPLGRLPDRSCTVRYPGKSHLHFLSSAPSCTPASSVLGRLPCPTYHPLHVTSRTAGFNPLNATRSAYIETHKSSQSCSRPHRFPSGNFPWAARAETTYTRGFDCRLDLALSSPSHVLVLSMPLPKSALCFTANLSRPGSLSTHQGLLYQPQEHHLSDTVCLDRRCSQFPRHYGHICPSSSHPCALSCSMTTWHGLERLAYIACDCPQPPYIVPIGGRHSPDRFLSARPTDSQPMDWC